VDTKKSGGQEATANKTNKLQLGILVVRNYLIRDKLNSFMKQLLGRPYFFDASIGDLVAIISA
jgi:hypothetical protein